MKNEILDLEFIEQQEEFDDFLSHLEIIENEEKQDFFNLKLED
tara:strand:+ start:129 stop:257 length:129 start_codon:yes stop_codon:yes gene_type:complete